MSSDLLITSKLMGAVSQELVISESYVLDGYIKVLPKRD